MKNRFETVRYVFIFIIYLGCTFFWFRLDGIAGSTPYALIAGSVIAILITQHKYRKALTAATLLWILSLVVIQKQTDWVYLRQNEEELITNNFLIFSFTIIIILHYIKSKYDNEHEIRIKKNELLADVNKTLSRTLNEKEEVIKQLRKTREALVHSEQLATVGKLTAGLAHELNNPLNYIGGVVTPLTKNLKELAELVQPNQTEEIKTILNESEELLNTLKQGTNRASVVIQSLVKISPGQITQKDEVFQVGRLLEQNIGILRTTHPDINFDIEIDPSLQMMGNPLEIRQLCQQILHNSTESLLSGTDNKEIKVSLKKVDKSMVLVVTDNGKGILPEHLDKVFDPFFTTREETNRKGMGLYMSYTIVKKHSGQIKMESTPGEGTSVSVFLPLA